MKSTEEAFIWKTFDEWRQKGYIVKKGTKARWSSDGIPKFSNKQVRNKENKHDIYGDLDVDIDDPFNDNSWCDPLDWGDN